MTTHAKSWRLIDLLRGSDQVFAANTIRTARYTPTTLVPKALFEQLCRYPVLWFLAVTALQLTPENIDADSRWSTLIPLLGLLLLTVSKDVYLDWKRRKSDEQVNSQTYSVWNGSDFVLKASSEIEVGTLVFLQDRMVVPADILLVASGHAQRICYIDKQHFHGSANLATKQAVKETQQILNSFSSEEVARKLPSLRGIVKVTDPCPDFTKFEGSIRMPRSPKSTPLHIDNFIIRQSVIFATPWIVGLVVYTGMETKAFLNISEAKKRVGRLDRTVNRGAIYLIIAVLVLSLVLSLLHCFASSHAEDFLLTFINFILLLHDTIPITLFLTVDIVRICQAYFMQVDAQLEGSVEFKTGDINEELGQVEYVFANKSGLMSTSRSELSVMIIGDEEFWRQGEEPLQSGESSQPRGSQKQLSRDMEGEFVSTETNVHLAEEGRWLVADQPLHIQTFKRLQDICSTYRPANFEDYFECVALCNNVVVRDNGTYFSPWREDELLVQSARELGCVLEYRTDEEIEANVFGRPTSYDILSFSEYSESTRRTRILLQRKDDLDTAVYYVKGAIGPMANILDSNMAEYTRIEKTVIELNKRGIRTQILAKKTLEGEALRNIKDKFQAARLAVSQVNAKVEAVFQEIDEHEEATFLGIIGTSFSVSEETKEVVQSLNRAGIKLWLVSGDSESSTLSLAYQCGAVTAQQELLHLKSIVNEDTLQQELERSARQYIAQEESYKNFSRNNSYLSDDAYGAESQLLSHNYTVLRRIQGSLVSRKIGLGSVAYKSDKVDFALSIDGVTFTTAMQHKECKRLLTYLCFCAKVVCCHSFLPLQKGLAVRLVKENFSFRPVTLAIGRTGSAISMLQEADVGVGIQGKDNYANHVSDIVIERFGLLSPLLFKHGQWNYLRMTRAILLFLYRSVALDVVLIIFSLVNDFTVASMMLVSQKALWMYIFTLLPIAYLAVFDQQITIDEIPKVPMTYQDGQFQRKLGALRVAKFALLGVLQGLLLSAIIYPALLSILSAQGHTETRETLMLLFIITLTLAVVAQTCVEMNHFTWVFALVFSVGVGLLIVCEIVSNYYYSYSLYGVLTEVFYSGKLITVVFLAPTVCFVLAFSVRAYTRVFNPSLLDRLRQGKSLSTPKCQFPRLTLYESTLPSVYRPTVFAGSEEEDAYALKPLTLRFGGKSIEQEYQVKYIKANLPSIRGMLTCGVVLAVLWCVLDAAAHGYRKGVLYLRISVYLACGCGLALTYTKWLKLRYELASAATMTALVLVIGVTDLAISSEGMAVCSLVPVCTLIIVQIHFAWVAAVNVLNLVFFLLTTIYFFDSLPPAEMLLHILAPTVLHLGILIMAGHVGYVLNKTSRIGYQLSFATEKEVEKSRHILSLLLPPFVINKVVERDDDKYIAEDQGTVTVVFCDIYDFDEICEMYRPHELPAFLDEVFLQLDDLCQVNGVVKIETVGKTYMACSGLRSVEVLLPHELSSVSQARRAVDFAFSILRTIGSIRLKNGTPLQVKIGINSGPVISGVVGKHKPQFSLVGDSVNTASRMCSTIEHGNTIQISGRTRELMRETEGCVFEERKVWAKGKGDLQTFLVSEEKGPDGFASRGLMSVSVAKKQTYKDNGPIMATRGSFSTETRPWSAAPNVNLMPAFSFWPLWSSAESSENKVFRLEVARQSRTFLTLNLVVNCCVQCTLAGIRVAQHFRDEGETTKECTIAYIVIAVLAVLSVFVPKSVLTRRGPALAAIPLNLFTVCLTLLDIVYLTEYHIDNVLIEFLFQQTTLLWSGVVFAKAAMVVSGCYALAWLSVVSYSADPVMHVMYLFMLIFHGVINCWSLLVRERKLKKNFHLKRIEMREIEKNEKLLSHMMPKVVYERMKQDIVSPDRLRSVTLLFADIVGFTNWSSDKSPQAVVGMLSALFTQFDNLCVQFQVYKVHTIGDCYVVMGYNGETEERDPVMECLRVLCMAETMITVIQEVNQRENINLNMRIGIHTGDIIAGITGKDVVRYDIYGPAVLVANKMESNGTAGKVNVSIVTKELLERVAQGTLLYEDNKEILAESIGKAYMSYFVKVLDAQRLMQLAAE